MNREALSIVLVATTLSLSACAPDVLQVFETTAGTGAAGGGGAGGAGGATTTGTTTSTTSQGGGTTTTSTTSTTTNAGGGGSMCDPAPDGDLDGDGFTPNGGDCNDCEPGVNPNAIEIVGIGGDENCDGSIDEKLPPCDEAVSMDNQNTEQVLRAIELCKPSSGEKDWGIIGSFWAMPDGVSPLPANPQSFHLGHGVLTDFGPNMLPRAGKRVLSLSSGTARRPNDPGYQAPSGFNKQYNHPPAAGFPKEDPGCPNSVSGQANDGTALAVSLRVPSNVHGFSYDFSFYAWDFPQYVCSTFNDVFFSVLTPQLAGQPDANIGYDEKGHPVTLSSANFRVCGCQSGPPCAGGGGKMYDCALGTAQLLGTGFDEMSESSRGATGWLTTRVPVEPGSSISIRWGVYDAGDGIADATAILDNWQWLTTPGVMLETKTAD